MANCLSVFQDDLLAELEELEQEELDKNLLEVGTPATDNLPSVPVLEPAAAASKRRFFIINVLQKHYLFYFCRFHE